MSTNDDDPHAALERSAMDEQRTVVADHEITDSIEHKLNAGGVVTVDNFDGDKMNRYRLMSIACGGDCKRFDDMPGGVVDLEYYFCQRVEMVREESGEIVEPTRCVLIGKDGKAYGFMSDFITRELDRLISVFGNGPWTDPLPIKVTKFTTRKGRQCYSLGPA